jgi:hypothetical protein
VKIKMKKPVFDEIEHIFLEQGPDHGLTLRKRHTAVDIAATAYGDDLDNPPAERTKTKSKRGFLARLLTSTLEQNWVHDRVVPTFYRRGEVEYYDEEYDFLLTVQGSVGEKLNSLGEVDKILEEKNYTLGLVLYSSSEDCEKRRYCAPIEVTIEKSFDGTSETNILAELIIRKPCDSPTTSCNLLYARLEKLAAKYPSNSIINPAEFAMDFLEALG